MQELRACPGTNTSPGGVRKLGQCLLLLLAGCRSGTELCPVESQIYLKEALLWPEALLHAGLGEPGSWKMCVGDGELQRGAGIQLYNGPHCPQSQRHIWGGELKGGSR